MSRLNACSGLVGLALLAGVACNTSAAPPATQARVHSTVAVEEATIATLQAALQDGTTTARAIVRAHLDRIEAYDKRGPLLNSLVTVNPRALEEADRLDALQKSSGKLVGRLHGIPVVVKDNIDVAGLPLTAGFQGWREYYSPADAPIVKRIREAGGIIIAKASLSEFARGAADNINSVVAGYARNPYNTAYATGGSSGGTGASVAASFGVVGLGTDTGGSVRMPAAHNALAGHRPTVGLVPRTGMVPSNVIRDTPGPMTRTVTDLAILLDVISGPDAEDAATAAAPARSATFEAGLNRNALAGVRLGVLRQVFDAERTDPRVIEHFGLTLAELRGAGAEIIDPFVVPELDRIPRPPQTAARFKDAMTTFLANRPGIPTPSLKAIADSRLLHPLHQSLFEEAVKANPVATDRETIEGAKDEQRYRDAFTKALDGARVDAVVFPTWARLPVINGDRNTRQSGTGAAAQPAGGGSLTYVASTLQWPAISVPSGYIEGLPQGFQLLGRAWDDAKVIGYAYAYEQATRHRRSPPTVPPLPPGP